MIIESLSEWNPWWKKKEVDKDLLGMKREGLKELESSLEFREIKLLIGVRRSGKSTLFYQMIDSLLGKGVSPKEILLINFEDDVLSKMSFRDVFDAYQSNKCPDSKPYIFIDEVHRCEDWVLFLRKLYDLKKIKQIFITDSSSKFLKAEYADVLTGRNISIPVFPISFKEHLLWKNVSFDNPLERQKVNKIKKELLGFLQWGGFPEVFFKSPPAKKKLLTEYFSDIISKDIVQRYNATYTKIKPLTDFLVSNSTAPFSPRKYSRTHGLSLESISTYVEHLKEVSLFFFMPRFSYSVNAQQLSPKKVYACDTGLFNNLGFRFSENIGRTYENSVFIELRRRGKETYYWKDKYECDFLIKEGIKVTGAVQVCKDITPENTEREVNGLLEALQHFDLDEGLIITEGRDAEETIKGKKVRFVPLWKWLLGL